MDSNFQQGGGERQWFPQHQVLDVDNLESEQASAAFAGSEIVESVEPTRAPENSIIGSAPEGVAHHEEMDIDKVIHPNLKSQQETFGATSATVGSGFDTVDPASSAGEHHSSSATASSEVLETDRVINIDIPTSKTEQDEKERNEALRRDQGRMPTREPLEATATREEMSSASYSTSSRPNQEHPSPPSSKLETHFGDTMAEDNTNTLWGNGVESNPPPSNTPTQANEEPAVKKMKLDGSVSSPIQLGDRPGTYSRLVRQGGSYASSNASYSPSRMQGFYEGALPPPPPPPMDTQFPTGPVGFGMGASSLFHEPSSNPPVMSNWGGFVEPPADAFSPGEMMGLVGNVAQQAGLFDNGIEPMAVSIQLASSMPSGTGADGMGDIARIRAPDTAAFGGTNADGSLGQGKRPPGNEMVVNGLDVDAGKLNNDDEGIFDDAEDDVELPASFQPKPPPNNKALSSPVIPISTSNLTPKPPKASLGLPDDTFGDAEDDILPFHTKPASEATASEETKKPSLDEKSDTANAEAPKKKKKRKKYARLKKPIASVSTKEAKVATSILKGRTELSRVLPDDGCRLLAEKFWIFTTDQFDYVFDESKDFHKNEHLEKLRDEIRSEIAKSAICAEMPAKAESRLDTSESDTKDAGPILPLPQSMAHPGEASRDGLTDVSTGEIEESCKIDAMTSDASPADTRLPEGRVVSSSPVTVDLARRDSSGPLMQMENGSIKTISGIVEEGSHVDRSDVAESSGSDYDQNNTSDGVTMPKVDNAGSFDAMRESSSKDQPVISEESVSNMHGPSSLPSSSSTVCEEKGKETVDTVVSSTSQPSKEPEDSVPQTPPVRAAPANEASTSVQSPMARDDKDHVPCEAISEETQVSDPGEVRGSEVSEERLHKAELLLAGWKKQLAAWKSNSQSEHQSSDCFEKSFPVQGPLGCLIPKVIRNFLSSISVTTAYGFLSTKMTEMSPFIRALYLWRKSCELQTIKPNILARQMGGIVTRIDTALSSVPPADSYTRKWMGTSLVCLTAASKEFLIGECKVETPEQFIDGVTKEFADRLAAWRKARGKSELKGSGKAAMTSSWKASVRETLAADEGSGKVVTEDDIIELSRIEAPTDEPENEAPTEGPKPRKRQKKNERTLQRHVTDGPALQSMALLKRVVKPENAEFLATMGICTPEQLLEADKQIDSPLVLELMKHRSAATGKESHASACVRLLFDWASKVREEVKSVDSSEPIPTKKRGRKPLEGGNKPLSEAIELSKSVEARKETSNEPGVAPITTLSTAAQTFLSSIGITSSEVFLATKTTDIANAFALWREAQGMKPLKGTGTIATISGYKGILRRKGSAMGGDEGTTGAATTRRRKPVRPNVGEILQSLPSPRSLVVAMSHPDVLMGLARRRFFVRNLSVPRCVYEFELSVRKSTTNTQRSSDETSLFLCYCGKRLLNLTGRSEDEKTDVNAVSSFNKNSLGQSATSLLPVLPDVQVSGESLSPGSSNESFAVSRPGCGLVELGSYGALPYPRNEDRAELLSKVKRFLLRARTGDEKAPVANEARASDGERANVFVEKSTNLGTRCFFYASEPIEKGQVLELHFSPTHEIPSETGACEPFVAISNRLALVREISVCSLANLKAVVEQLTSILSAIKGDLEKETADEKDTQDQSSNEKLKRHTVRRRIHWLATIIQNSLESREKLGMKLVESDQRLLQEAKELSMTEQERRGLCEYFNHTEKAFVLEELSHEILCDAVQKGKLGSWYDKTKWCALSIGLLNKCLRKASVIMVSHPMGSVADQLEVVKEIELNVSEAVQQILSSKRDLGKLVFGNEAPENRVGCSISRDFFWSNLDRLPHDIAIDASDEEAYLEAMELCDEVAFSQDVKAALCGRTTDRCRVVAAKVPWRDGTVMRSVDDIKHQNAHIDEKWYIENQILSVAHAILSSDFIEWRHEPMESGDTKPLYSYDRLATVALTMLEASAADAQVPTLEQRGGTSVVDSELKFLRGLPSDSRLIEATPTTLPLFLAIIWPRLRNRYRWCLEAGTEPYDVTFYPPGHRRRRQRDTNNESGRKRIERSKTRAKVERSVREVGFGEIPKLTKRMFVSTSPEDLDPSNGASVSHTLRQFISSILSKLPGDGSDECRRRMADIEKAVCDCFDDLVPALVSSDGNDTEDSSDEKGNNSTAYLMQVLLILPALLQQSDVPMLQIEETMGVIRDLAHFIASNNGELFEEPIRLYREEYESGHKSPRAFLEPRIQRISAKLQADAAPQSECADSKGEEGIREIVLPEEYEEITEYMGTTLGQMLPCRATQDDVTRRGRKNLRLGHPGMVCRNCRGAEGDGRYFFTSLDSLNTAANAILCHLYRCTKVTPELKSKLAMLKTRHAEDRKLLPHGAAATFYARLWKRMHSRGGDEEPEMYVLSRNPRVIREESEEQLIEGAEDIEEEHAVEFRDHRELLAYIDQTPPWSEKADIRDRIQLYYKCVAYGGELYMTNAMPKNFCSEWLLSKTVSPDRLSTKRSYFSG